MPVLAVGRSPSPESGGLHQFPEARVLMSAAGWSYGVLAYFCMLSGPSPLRLVFMT